MKSGFQIVPKMHDNVIFIYFSTSSGNECIAQLRCPNDGQMNDNLELAQTVSNAYKRRIRKSV